MAAAAATAVISPACPRAALVSINRKAPKKAEMKVSYIKGLNSYGGLKAQDNKVVSMGMPVCTEQCFAKIVSSLKGRRGGGALSSTCNAVGEIFRIAAIMNVLVLIGVAVGFVLLRIEASVEEAE